MNLMENTKISQINGKTATFGLIGNPVSHTLSPQIHAHFAQLYNVNMAYLPFCVQDKQLEIAVNGAFSLGIRGLNVTVPHKITIMPHLFAVDKMAKCVGAVNTLVKAENAQKTEQSQEKSKNIPNILKNDYIGYNTDYIGAIRTIEKFEKDKTGVSLKNSHVAILGAGGSAYAASIAAAEKSAKKLTIVNRTIENANTLAFHIKKYYNINIDLFTPQDFNNTAKNPPNYDIIIQTTTVGFEKGVNGSLVSNLAVFGKTQLAFDLIYTPWQTQFLQDAQNANVPNIVNGFPMLVHQAFAAFQLWHNIPSPQAHELEEQIEELSKRLYSD
ncbi:MAG: shikimate dehydrogenase [Firmicutes bacterium]|nr:shikimate dehydrogenase [Bacillota bacterium]